MKRLLIALVCIILTTNVTAQLLGRLGVSTGTTRNLWSEGHVEYKLNRAEHVAGSFYTNLQNTVIGARVGSKLGTHVNAGVGIALSDGKLGPLAEAEYCFDKNYQRKYIPYVGGAVTQKFAFIRAGVQFKMKKPKRLNFE